MGLPADVAPGRARISGGGTCSGDRARVGFENPCNLQKCSKHPRLTFPDLIVANSILDLRLLATQDWEVFFEAMSILEKILSDDPADLCSNGF